MALPHRKICLHHSFLIKLIFGACYHLITENRFNLEQTEMAPITASAPRPTGQLNQLREPSLPVKLLTAGSAACVADLITFPLDTAKVRLQVNR